MTWAVAGVAGAAAPALALLAVAADPFPFAARAAPVVAVGLMASGMTAAAATGRLRIGMVAAGLVGAGLVLMALALGRTAAGDLPAVAFAIAIASLSFAARGALFARSAGARGWWIALAVVAGEAAMLATAAALPGRLPAWLLALLPAQWASMAVRSALGGGGTLATWAPLLALGGTAAATLLVARLWPRRWPYLVMFTTWLAMSAVVLHHAP